MAEEIITSTNAETATDHEYNASEIQVLKGMSTGMPRPLSVTWMMLSFRILTSMWSQ